MSSEIPQISAPATEASHLGSMADSISTIFTTEPTFTQSQRTTNTTTAAPNHQGTEIYSCSNVELYFISPQQNAVTPSKLVTLKIITLQDGGSEGKPPAYIDAGQSWLYPLIPLQSPLLRSRQGHYLFPDVTSTNVAAEAGVVGIILPNFISPEDRCTFETWLLTLTGFETFPADEETSELCNNAPSSGLMFQRLTSDSMRSTTSSSRVTKIADGMTAVAELASEGISLSTNKTIELWDRGTIYTKTQLPQNVENPSVIIPPDVKETVATIREYSTIAVSLSSSVVSKVAEATTKLASFIAPYVHSSATWTVAELSGQSQTDSEQYVSNMLKVTGSAVNGLNMIHSGLRHAGRVLGRAITTNAMGIVEHCYGPAAADVIGQAVTTVGNVTTLGLCSTTLMIGPEQLISRVAKDTTKAVLIKMDDNTNTTQNL